MTKNYLDRIVIDPDIMMGKPTIKGTRITVEKILHKLSQDISTEEVLKDYPRLTREDIQAALEYAADSVSSEEIRLISSKR